MNERILELERRARQLAQEAVDQKKYNTYSEYQQSLSDQSYAKFAELIVKECMRQIEEQYKPVLEDEVMMNEAHWKGYLHCGVDSVVAIREHFGVEE